MKKKMRKEKDKEKERIRNRIKRRKGTGGAGTDIAEAGIGVLRGVSKGVEDVLQVGHP
jgi:hypothetical protein